jgi:signal transduction histidine kinase
MAWVTRFSNRFSSTAIEEKSVPGSTAYQISLLFVAQSVIFSALLLILYPRFISVYYWCCSNLILAVSIFIVATGPESVPVWVSSCSGALGLLGAAFKPLAYSAGTSRKQLGFFSQVAIATVALFGLLLILFPATPFKLFMLVCGGAIITLASLQIILTSRVWAGTTAKWVQVACLVLSLAGLSTRIVGAYPFGPNTTFMKSNADQVLNLILLSFFSFILQVSFLALIAARTSREQIFVQRRAARFKTRTIVMAQEQQKLSALADERMSLLRMLTHEVRQPLNNAQAALQTVLLDLSGDARSPEALKDVAKRAQRTVGEVVLAISNSIVGASLVNSSRPAALQQTDMCTVARLAMLDTDPADLPRVVAHYHQDSIFAAVDPVLLRLAIRNLLENALKFSSRDTKVAFDVDIDDERMLATFSVRNVVADPSLVIDDMFGFEKRGADSRYGGLGLGLYIVKRCADLHHGHIVHEMEDGNVIKFELAIPC